jgi:hypothetical protein
LQPPPSPCICPWFYIALHSSRWLIGVTPMFGRE